MNNKLKQQLSQITDYDPQVRMQKQMAWQQNYHNRQNFLEDLVKEIDGMEFESDKERSNYYSWTVAKFDKENMQVF